MPLVTLKDVAREVNLSVSCVARALKGRPDIPATTCKRVHEAAERLGYKPNPMLTALAAYRQTRMSADLKSETLAFLTNRGSERSCLQSRESGDLLRGARMRAESLGYRLEYFNMGDDKDSHRRMARTLRARGIRGLLLRTFPLDLDDVHLPFDQFHIINLFSKPHSERATCISSYHAQSMELALQNLKTQGTRHPALILNKNISQSIHHGWLMAYRVYADAFEQASVHLVDDGPISADPLMHWVRDQTSRPRTAQRRRTPIDTLIYGCSENLIPKDHMTRTTATGTPRIISMDLVNRDCGLSGIYQDRPQAGAMAVEWLQNMIMTSHVSIERKPGTLLVPGLWVDA